MGEIPMTQNLDLLRHNYCKPTAFTAGTDHKLFRLERESEQGKIFLAKAPTPVLEVQDFDPAGLGMTYRDDVTGAELPVFAVFNLEGPARCSFEISSVMPPVVSEPATLEARIPLNKIQPFVRQVNQARVKAERGVAVIAGLLGILPGVAFLLSPMGTAAGLKAPFVFLAGWLLGSILVSIVSLNLLDRICPWKKLVITAEFDGILPKEARDKAKAARDYFDNLYLVVDQQNRWKSDILPDPAARALDPLLVGEIKRGGTARYFVIDQFDLTEAEAYLADEFAVKSD
jgi:hypothetical protein